jgi:hypothetical protein
MDQLDAEHILVNWADASEDDRRGAALYGISELSAALTYHETEVPVIAEKIGSGEATIDDWPPLHRAACKVMEAILSWKRTYPELADQWDALGRRGLVVLAAHLELDTSGSSGPTHVHIERFS